MQLASTPDGGHRAICGRAYRGQRVPLGRAGIRYGQGGAYCERSDHEKRH